MLSAHYFAARDSSFVVELGDTLGSKSITNISNFVLLAGAGFFELGPDGVYRFATPTPTAESIKAAYQRYYVTEDWFSMFHPEQCISPLPRAEALTRLQAMMAAEARSMEEDGDEKHQ